MRRASWHRSRPCASGARPRFVCSTTPVPLSTRRSDGRVDCSTAADTASAQARVVRVGAVDGDDRAASIVRRIASTTTERGVRSSSARTLAALEQRADTRQRRVASSVIACSARRRARRRNRGRSSRRIGARSLRSSRAAAASATVNVRVMSFALAEEVAHAARGDDVARRG